MILKSVSPNHCFCDQNMCALLTIVYTKHLRVYSHEHGRLTKERSEHVDIHR